MWFLKGKRLHERKVAVLKEQIAAETTQLRAPTTRNRKVLTANGITLEIKKAIGSRHA